MSDIFEQDIDAEDEDIMALEDNDASAQTFSKNFVFPKDLYKLKLEYSCEGIYAQFPEGTDPKPGDYVLVPTRYGDDLAKNLGRAEKPIGIKPNDIVQVTRLANESDLKHAEELVEKEAQAFDIFREKVKVHHLDMKLITVHFLVGEPKALFFFSSDNRVDFRELVKDLVSIFKMRIELRQIGVRDEAKQIGGLGDCGRPFCCKTYLDDFQQVSIKMAKEQNLSLNSVKISGTCGRLMCCLKYENDVYQELIKGSPTPESLVDTPKGRGTVMDVSLLKGCCRVRLLSNPDTPETFACEECKTIRRGKAKNVDKNSEKNG